MEFKIGKYTITQRTEYSNFRLIDEKTKIDITKENKDILDRILDERQKQTSRPNDYFEIEEDTIIKLKKAGFSLHNLFIPDNIVAIDWTAFSESDFLRIYLPDTITSLANRVFENCCFLEAIDIPDSIKNMGCLMFGQCSKLETVKLPNTLKKLPNGTFAECSSLKDINLPLSIEEIGGYAFLNCSSLSSIKLPENLKGLGSEAFEGCINLKNISFPKILKNIDSNCFNNCISLKEIFIPDNVIFIGKSAFANCINLESVKLPNGLNYLHDEIFLNCKNLKNITLPDSIEAIGTRIFEKVTTLENINIPKDLKIINQAPFKFSSIRSLTFNHDLKSLDADEGDLIADSKIDKLIINSNVKIITKDAFLKSGSKIKTIDYIGTEKQFDEFKKNNKELFDCLKKAKKVNFIKSIDDIKKHKSKNRQKNINEDDLFI